MYPALFLSSFSVLFFRGSKICVNAIRHRDQRDKIDDVKEKIGKTRFYVNKRVTLCASGKLEIGDGVHEECVRLCERLCVRKRVRVSVEVTRNAKSMAPSKCTNKR